MIAILAITVGIGVTASAPAAATSPPRTTVHSAVHQTIIKPMDWWW